MLVDKLLAGAAASLASVYTLLAGKLALCHLEDAAHYWAAHISAAASWGTQ